MFMGLIALNDDDILNSVHCVMAKKGITDERLYSGQPEIDANKASTIDFLNIISPLF